MKKIKLTPAQKEIRRRIIESTYQAGISHLGSCLTAIDIIETVYDLKGKEDHFVLSSGHAGLALYAVLEKQKCLDSALTCKLHIHPDRNSALGIEVSTGSLGQGLPIALGMALADPSKMVYCLISDGECAEGSIWESLNIIAEKAVPNLVAIVNANGWGAYDPVPLRKLARKIKGFGFKVIETDGHNVKKILGAIQAARRKMPAVVFAKTTVEQLPFLTGLDAHYHVMTEEEYKTALVELQ
jgi:transketolase